MGKSLHGFKILGSLSLEALLKQRLEEESTSTLGTEGIGLTGTGITLLLFLYLSLSVCCICFEIFWKGSNRVCTGRSVSMNHMITLDILQKL